MAVYKTIPLADANNRTVRTLSAEEKTAIQSTVQQFVDLFKAKHL